MITFAQLKIYASFLGDIDAYARSGSKNERAILNDDHWMTIQNLINDILIMNSGYSSPAFNASVQKRISEHCETDEVLWELQKLSLKKW